MYAAGVRDSAKITTGAVAHLILPGVADEGSPTRLAELLGIGQGPVSQRIREPKTEVGTQLVVKI